MVGGRKMQREKAEIHFRSRHETGNIYWILGAVRMQMQKERRITDYNNAWERVQQTDYAVAIEILRELVNLIDDDGRY
jgi:hypothetical protein